MSFSYILKVLLICYCSTDKNKEMYFLLPGTADKMEAESNQTHSEDCLFRSGGKNFLVSIDVITLLIGKPVMTKLLWITVASNKPADILNLNLALFHNLQYYVCLLHLVFLYVWPSVHVQVLKVLLVYAQTGGPMNLCFITVERYVAVIHPTSFYLLSRYRVREAAAAAVWLMSVNIALAAALDGSSRLTNAVLKTLPMCVMVAMSAVMFWCSVHVAKALMKSGPSGDKLHPMKRRAFRTVCATNNISLFCYVPVAVMERFRFVEEGRYDCTLMPLCIMLLSAASVVHPVFYLFTQGELFPCLRQRK